MNLSRSGDTYVLRCRCNAVNLSFCDTGVAVKGTVKCSACGTEAEWGTLVDESDGTSPEPKEDAEIHVLRT